MVVGTGCGTRIWHLPRKLLVNASPFFAAALNGSFSEATSRKITLPETGPEIFALFVRWLHVGEIGRISFAPEDDWVDRLNASTKAFVQACILGDKLGCSIFRDLAMLELIEHQSKEVMREEEIRYVFDHSTQSSKLRQFTIDQLRYVLQEGILSEYACLHYSGASFAEDFGPIFLEASLKANGAAIDPQMQKERYLEVLTGDDDDLLGPQNVISWLKYTS